MTQLTDFLLSTLSDWSRDGVPVAVWVALGLAVLGWFLPLALFRLTGMGARAVLRTLVLSVLLLVAAGGVASALLYALSGVQLAAAWDSDPWGGLAYFAATGAQLAVVGLGLVALRTAVLTARGAHRTLE